MIPAGIIIFAAIVISATLTITSKPTRAALLMAWTVAMVLCVVLMGVAVT